MARVTTGRLHSVVQTQRRPVLGLSSEVRRGQQSQAQARTLRASSSSPTAFTQSPLLIFKILHSLLLLQLIPSPLGFHFVLPAFGLDLELTLSVFLIHAIPINPSIRGDVLRR